MTQPIHNPAIAPPGPISPAQPTAPVDGATSAGGAAKGPSFAEVLATKTAGPHFSRHALDRLKHREIELDAPTLGRLTGGIASAAAKGSRDSVIFIDGTAFVVSVRNNTVITAVGSEHMREHVFTNIDSAVIA
ncbi:MAG: TIGR02530 family flagellar biosynthesis protein [Solirubrobacteraceae bacterium]|jgi:flagellar operon protein